MSQRQVRIDDHEKIRLGMPDLLNKKINVVLTDNTVQFGELQRVDQRSIVIKNMRRKSVQIPIDKIFEIYSDNKA